MVRPRKEKKVDRNKKAIMDAKNKEAMKHPVNRFMNELDKEGKIKYPIAAKLRKYFVLNPDPALNAMRMANSLLHEIRWHKDQAAKYYADYLTVDAITMIDKNGKVMTKEECYTSYIQETQVGFVAISKLREHLINGLLPVVDEEVFNFQKYNDYVLEVERIAKELGYELFPETVEVTQPL